MIGAIAPTDFGWYEFLSHRGSWNEVNFWTPSTHFAFRAEEFSPFLFKLKAPHNAICGFGYFARYSPLPDWLAWSCFAEGNGYPSLASMRDKISEIRRRMRYVGTERVAEVGCIVVVNVSLLYSWRVGSPTYRLATAESQADAIRPGTRRRCASVGRMPRPRVFLRASRDRGPGHGQ